MHMCEILLKLNAGAEDEASMKLDEVE